MRLVLRVLIHQNKEIPNEGQQLEDHTASLTALMWAFPARFSLHLVSSWLVILTFKSLTQRGMIPGLIGWPLCFLCWDWYLEEFLASSFKQTGLFVSTWSES